MLRCRTALLAFAIILVTPFAAVAQGTSTPAPQTAATPAAPPAPEETLLKPEQLDALVAPIALYPDALLLRGRCICSGLFGQDPLGGVLIVKASGAGGSDVF